MEKLANFAKLFIKTLMLAVEKKNVLFLSTSTQRFYSFYTQSYVQSEWLFSEEKQSNPQFPQSLLFLLNLKKFKLKIPPTLRKHTNYQKSFIIRKLV